jgi:hypothetical protein
VAINTAIFPKHTAKSSEHLLIFIIKINLNF